MDATFPPSPLCFFDFNQTRCKPKFGTPKMFIDGPLKKFRTTNFDTQGNARRVSNHDFDFENWTPVFRLAKRLVYCISLWVEKNCQSVERVDACNCGAQETHQRLDFRAGGEEIAFKVPKTAVRLLPDTNTPKADINNNKYTRECEIWTRNIKF